MQSYFNQMAGAMSDVSPEQLQRMKDMFNGLNQMLEMREQGQDTTAAFDQFMQQFGDFFPGNPESLDELLEQMAQQMAAMQNLLNSMTPEQRAQLQGLAEALLEDMDLRWQVDRLGANLRQAFPGAGWDRRPPQLPGPGPARLRRGGRPDEPPGRHGPAGEPADVQANSPGALADVDIERAREHPRRRRRPLARAAGRADASCWRRPA